MLIICFPPESLGTYKSKTNEKKKTLQKQEAYYKKAINFTSKRVRRGALCRKTYLIQYMIICNKYASKQLILSFPISFFGKHFYG